MVLVLAHVGTVRGSADTQTLIGVSALVPPSPLEAVHGHCSLEVSFPVSVT